MTDAVLLRALAAAPRPYRLPPLPGSADEARARGSDVALAFAIEAARTGMHGVAEVRELFTSALADLVRVALARDPAFRALLLRTGEAQVREYVQLTELAPADRRQVRSAVDAIAHPGKLRTVAPGPARTALERLHALATAQDWTALRAAAAAQGKALHDLLAGDALSRLERADALRRAQPVQRYLALYRERGPLAGSDAAATRGRAAARTGEEAEATTVQAFEAIARLLDAHAGTACHRVVQGLRIPRGFPGTRAGKEEWDVALVRGSPVADLVLLAEVKAAPAAATPDLPRLLRGLHRLAEAPRGRAAGGMPPMVAARRDACGSPPHEDQTGTGGSHAFATARGEVRIAGASLQRLRPDGDTLPPHAVYCCTAPPEAAPSLLAAASKAVLLAEPASLAFAQRLANGEAPAPAELAPVWEALPRAPRLRAVLHQDRTARTVRDAMLHPRDLLAAVAAELAR